MRLSMRRVFGTGLFVCLVLTAACCAHSADSAAPSPVVKLSPLAEKLPGGQVDWGQEMFFATGEGAVPTPEEQSNRARAQLMAKDYAKMAAIANLLMLIEGTSISYEATGKDYMVQDATLRQTIEGYVKNVNILKTEKIQQDGGTIIRVTVGTRMYGQETPGTALLMKLSELAIEDRESAPVKVELKEPRKTAEAVPAVEVAAGPKAATKKPAAPPAKAKPAPRVEAVKPADTAKPVEVAADPPPSAGADGSYTSVIIDSLGLNVMRAMSPKIRTEDGSEVWGTIKIDPDAIQDYGPVAYTTTVADARKSSRAGSRPLEIKAVGRAGGNSMCDVVISNEDVARLKEADRTAKPPFLAQLKVIFVVDPARSLKSALSPVDQSMASAEGFGL